MSFILVWLQLWTRVLVLNLILHFKTELSRLKYMYPLFLYQEIR